MNKTETNKLLNKIKGYYNSQFFVDDYILEAWHDTFKEYDLDDCIEHIKDYIKDYPDIAPKPHTFRKGLLTPSEKRMLSNKEYKVNCNLCGRLMDMNTYDSHYDKCLSTFYLIDRIYQVKGTKADYEQIFYLEENKFNALYEKYKGEDLCTTTLMEK